MRTLFALALAVTSAACGAVEPRTSVVASYDTVIAPILGERCAACHGESKAKGRLRLHTRAALLAGGDSGPALVPGDVAASELLRRARLPLDDIDHMPPDDKPQPSARELDALEAWIAAGAAFEGHVAALEPFVLPAEVAQPRAELATATPRAPQAAIEALRAEFVHVEPIEPGSSGLGVDFAAIAKRVDDELALRLLAPVSGSLVELSLARAAIGPRTLALVPSMPHLRRIDLGGCQLDGAALLPLIRHPALREVALTRNRLDESALEVLISLPELERLYLWKSGLGADAIASLRNLRPDVAIDAGDAPEAAALDVEPEITLASDAPIPGAPPPGSAEAPINTNCPITGSPVNPKYVVSHEGRVIGFCCPNCPAEFSKDPAQYASKLP